MTRVYPDATAMLNGNFLSFTIQSDGMRFLVHDVVGDTVPASIVVIVNWTPPE